MTDKWTISKEYHLLVPSKISNFFAPGSNYDNLITNNCWDCANRIE